MDTGSRTCKNRPITQLSNPNETNQPRFALNSNYGTAEDLNALATALHDRGMYLMVDVVANHMV